MPPIIKPERKILDNPPKDSFQITWIGHATFLLQFDGYNVLTDPIFSDRCSAVQWAGPKVFISFHFV